MAPELFVPAVFRDALQEFARLDSDQAQRLIEAVRAVEPLERVSAIEAAARSASPPGFEDSSERIVASLLSLQREMREYSPLELAKSLSGVATLGLDPAERAALMQRADALLSTPAVRTTSAGVDLLTQHQRNYRSARIFTDIRPLFGEDVTQEPDSAVIIEMLQLEVWGRDGDRETLYVAMDEPDLEALQGVIERALKKTRSVRGMLDRQGIRTFELDEKPQ